MTDVKSILTDTIRENLLNRARDDNQREWLSRQLDQKADYDKMYLSDGRKSIKRVDVDGQSTVIAFGGAIKAVDGDTPSVEGYLVHFTDENNRDAYGEYFTAETDFRLDDYPVIGERVLYHHGLDGDFGVKPIGRVSSLTVDKNGLYIKATLDLKTDTERLIYEMAKTGILGWSSGALPTSVKVDENGFIQQWAIIEATETPTPAGFQLTKITAKTEPQVLATGSQGESASASVTDTRVHSQSKTNQPSKGHKTMDDMEMESGNDFILSKLDEILGMLRESGKMDGMNEEELKAEMLDEAEKATDGATDMQKAFDAKLATIVANAVTRAIAKRQATINAVNKAFDSVASQAPAKTARQTVGTVGASSGFIGVSEPRKYAHLSASDMALFVQIQKSRAPHMSKATLDQLVGEDFVQVLKHKMASLTRDDAFARQEDVSFVKSVLPFKANEVNTTTNTGYGPEWVGEVWATTIWDKARNRRMYRELFNKGIFEVEVPQGSETVNISTEGADPTVYSLQQNADLDATNRPSVVIKNTPFGTGTVALTPGALGAVTSYSVILDEDSVIPILPQINRQLVEKMEETIEQALINGDTATANTTNINFIDGQPATGLSRPYYLNNNGILKYPLVTATALSRDAGGTLSLNDYLETLKLLSPEFQDKLDRLVFLIDPYVNYASMNLPEIKTQDVNRAYTIENGTMPPIWGIPVVRSGFMLKANNAGKVPSTGGTLGRLALIYAPYWAFGWKRNIKLETEYRPLEQATSVVATMRFGFVARGRDASAVSYNVGI